MCAHEFADCTPASARPDRAETITDLSALRLCFVTAARITVQAFLSEHLKALVAAGAHVEVVTSPGPGALPVTAVDIPIARPIAPLADLRALWRLWRHFRATRPQIVHSVTPKAGLLAMIAARLAGVPVRVHIFTGQVWATRRGPARWLLKSIDRLMAGCATHLLADSGSQRDFLVDEGVVAAGSVTVLGAGSICGVNLDRFRPDARARAEVRVALGVDPGACVLVFVGRMNRDKGIPELLEAFRGLAGDPAQTVLLLVGPDEAGMQAATGPMDRVIWTGATPEPERFLAAGDIFVLPSHREGFGSSVIEAAAAGLPAVVSRIYGLTDAVVDGQTGLLVPCGDARLLARALRELLADPARRRSMGEAARARALAEFPRERLTAELLAFYGKIRPPVIQ